MPDRPPAEPPELPGFTPIELIGSGGYADVFLYEQQMPARQVAVKVLVADIVVEGPGRSTFTGEANLMAKVSAHPFIVQVFQADIAPDGRPYLAMEYYPGPNYYDRARREQMTVAEVLRTGVQLASAVETAHRAGVLHRDIKPANVLTSEYNRPGLTDFGIAAAHGPGDDSTDGVSIPWAPPEALGDAPDDARSDVYGLAATLFTLLVGRSPFEIPGGDNSPLAMMSRVERNDPPPIGRPDVPTSLERVLAGAMAKNPAHRPGSAAEFGRQLRAIESELKLAVTPLELAGETGAVRVRTDVAADDDSTRIKPVAEIAAQPDMIRSIGATPAGSPPVQERRREGMLGEPAIDDTVIPPSTAGPADLEPVPSGSLNPWYVVAGVAAAVLVAVVSLTVVLGGDSDGDDEVVDDFAVNDGFDSPVAVAPSAVGEITVVVNDDGSNTFSWTSVGEGLDYLVTEDGATPMRISETTVTTFAACIDVETVASSGLISALTRSCA